MIDFWERYQQIANSKQITNKAVYSSLKVHQGTFSNWMTRGFLPKLDQALEIARILDVSLEYLISGEERIEGIKLPMPQDVVSAVKQLQRLKGERKQNVVKYINDQYTLQQAEDNTLANKELG
jgi:transcriptional regulator with XRE-family HTH domain